MILAMKALIATAAETSSAPHIREPNRNASTLRMCATEHPIVATDPTK